MSTVAFVLGAFTAVGGMMGYARKGSIMSAVGGVAVGLAYGYSGTLLSVGGTAAAQGRHAAMITSGLLGAGMAVRYLKTLKAVPLVLTIVGVGAFTYFAVSA